MRTPVLRPLLVALALGAPAGALAEHAHEHGVAELRVALEGATLLVEFESPLSNLVGFEHVPRSDDEKAALADLARTLRDPARLIVLSEQAGCRPGEIELELPDGHDHADHGHDHGGHDHRSEHGHHHDDDDGHGDAYVAWEFHCVRAPEAIELRVIEAFPDVRALRVETAGPRGQSAQRVEQPRVRLAL